MSWSGWAIEVTLFASGDSVSRADLVPCVPMALRLDANVRDPIPYYMLMLDRVRELRRRIRHSAFPHRPVSFPVVSADRQPDRDHAARPAGSARSQAALCRLQRHAAGVDLQRAAPADPEGQLCRAPSITEFPPICSSPPTSRAAAIWRFSAASRRRSGPIGPFGSRARRNPAQDRGQGRQGRRSLFPREDRAAAQSTRRRIHRRDQRARQERVPGRCTGAAVSRSTGRSRSDCP